MEGSIVYIRKIAAAAGLATGAALALAPLASAVPDPTLVTDTLGSEVASLNGLFQFDALLSGVPSTDYAASGVHGLDTIDLAKVATDAPQIGTPSTLDFLLYGVDPFKAGVSGDSGAFSEFNGALMQFDNAYNVELYSNGGALDTNLSDYLYNGTIQTVLGTANETPTQAFDTLYNAGIGDLSGFFQSNLSFLDIPTAVPGAADPAAAFDIGPTLTSEITSLNGLFGLDATLAGIPSTDIIQGSGPLPFDTIDPTNTNSIFDTLVFGAAGPSTDPGSYDVLNGALGEFDNAYNVGLFSLLDPTGTFDPTDIIGTHASLLDDGALSAIGGFLSLGVSDLLGYFEPAALVP
jgi:hypothetical protein